MAGRSLAVQDEHGPALASGANRTTTTRRGAQGLRCSARLGREGPKNPSSVETERRSSLRGFPLTTGCKSSVPARWSTYVSAVRTAATSRFRRDRLPLASQPNWYPLHKTYASLVRYRLRSTLEENLPSAAQLPALPHTLWMFQRSGYERPQHQVLRS